MTKTKELPRLKSSMYDNEALQKKFSAKQLNGLLKGFQTIRGSNIMNAGTKEQPRLVCSLPAKVDYWVGKNETEIDRVFKDCLKHMDEIIEANCLQKTVDGVKFIVYQGKDETDIVLEGPGGFYREVKSQEDAQKTQLEHLSHPIVWLEEIEPAVEGKEAEGDTPAVEAKEAVVKKHPYVMQYLSVDCEKAYGEQMQLAENEEKYPLSLYKLDAENLEGVKIAWPNPGDPRNNLEEFRKIIFEYAIVG